MVLSKFYDMTVREFIDRVLVACSENHLENLDIDNVGRLRSKVVVEEQALV